MTLVTQLIIAFFAGLIGVVMIIASFSLLFGKTAPLVPVYTDNGSHIEDHVGAIDNSYELEQYLTEFRSLTGISPLVLTVYDSVWENEYTKLEDYAYDYYIQKFSDEQHWLFVYSASDNSDEWSWHAMQGNDTGKIITMSKFDKFRVDLQENLEDGGVSVGGAFAVSFKNSLKYMMDDEHDVLSFLIALLIGAVFAVFAVKESRTQIKLFKVKHKKYAGAVLAPKNK